jgi:DNA-binding LacI/PurR family transcriptional regulator
MVTIKDIARESKFSVSVVSRALNPKPDQKVKATTEKAIKAVAERLGYRPNHTAAFLQRGRNPSIGVFLRRRHNSLLADLIFGISDVAGKYGLLLNFYFGLEEKSFSDFLDSANETRNTGIISYMPYTPMQKFWHNKCAEFIANGGKAIFINDPGFHDLDIPSVSIDNYSGGRKAAQYLISRNSGMLVGIDFSAHSWQMRERTRGFKDFASSEKMQEKVHIVTREQLRLDFLDRLAEKYSGPIGIFCGSDYDALELIRLFYAENRIHEVGKKFLVIGFDNLAESSYTAPALTTFNQDFQQVGRISMQKLANIIINHAEEESEIIQPELVIRESA